MIIDKQGKIFGKWNMIDFSVVVLILYLLPMFIFGWKLFNKQPPPLPGPPEKTVRLQVRFTSLIPELAQIIGKGDIQVDYSDSRTIAKVVKVVSSEHSEVLALNEAKNIWVNTNHPTLRDIVLDLEVICASRNNGLFFGTQPIRIGSTFSFETSKYSITGIIIGLEE